MAKRISPIDVLRDCYGHDLNKKKGRFTLEDALEQYSRRDPQTGRPADLTHRPAVQRVMEGDGNNQPAEEGEQPAELSLEEKKQRTLLQTRRGFLFLAAMGALGGMIAIKDSVSCDILGQRFYGADEFDRIADTLLPKKKKRNPARWKKEIAFLREMLHKYPGSVVDTNTGSVLTKYLQRLSLGYNDGEKLVHIDPCDQGVEKTGSFVLMESAAKAFMKANERVKNELGICIPVISMYRGSYYQSLKREAKGFFDTVGKAKYAMHTLGQAVDLNYLSKHYPRIVEILEEEGWHQTEIGDCGHVEFRKPEHYTADHKRDAQANKVPGACTSGIGRGVMKYIVRPGYRIIKK